MAYINQSGVEYSDDKLILVKCPKKFQGSFSIPKSVIKIENRAFENVKGLESVEIPDSVVEIGNYTFRGCSRLTSINIPSSVSKIGKQAFSCCSSLSSIVVDEKNRIYDSRYHSNAIIKTNSDCIITGCKNTFIPNSISTIDAKSFLNCVGLKRIQIPESVTNIGISAFEGCEGLEYVEISGKILKINDFSFYRCKRLENVMLPNSVECIGESAFKNCENLLSINIPSSVKSICCAAFEDSGLTSIYVPKSVNFIGSSAFEHCTNLTSVFISSGLKYLDYRAFSRCKNIIFFSVDEKNPFFCSDDGVLFRKAKEELVYYPAGNGKEHYSIPDSVTRIGEDAFMECAKLKYLTIPNELKEIFNGAFYGCSNLISIYIPKNVEYIGFGSFIGCDAITSFEVDPENPNYYTKDGVLFDSDDCLLEYIVENTRTEYVIPNFVKGICTNAFTGCKQLESIVVPTSIIKMIDDSTIVDCDNLKFIKIERGKKADIFKGRFTKGIFDKIVEIDM